MDEDRILKKIDAQRALTLLTDTDERKLLELAFEFELPPDWGDRAVNQVNIGKYLGVSANTVRHRLDRALRHLRALLSGRKPKRRRLLLQGLFAARCGDPGKP